MKIKDTPYYKENKLLQIVDEDDNIGLDISGKTRSFRALLENSLKELYLFDAELVIHKDKLRRLTKCTDFIYLGYASQLNKLYETEECYFHPEYEIFIIISSNLTNDYDEQMFEEGLYKVNYLYYDNQKPEALTQTNAFFEEYLEKYVSKVSKVSILYQLHNAMHLKTHTIKPYRIDIDTMYNDDFKEVHHRVKDVLTHQNKGIVLFHGIAGSGKTNYIKWLTAQIPNKKFIFVPTTMIGSLTDPSFISLLIDNKNSVLVMEDCENYIADRNTANSKTDVVSVILNLADGILSDVIECQLICTFNSDISKIDSALLRKGRLIAEYKFKKLSAQKSNKYLQSVGESVTVSDPYSLAELTNMDVQEFKDTENKPKIGFK